MITPDRIEAWRRMAAVRGVHGSPSGNALLDACYEIESLQRKVTATETQRDRARESAKEVGERHDELIEDLCKHVPEQYDDDVAVEAIVSKWAEDMAKGADARMRDVRDEVQAALDALHEYDGAEAAKVLSDLLKTLGGGR